MMKIIRSSPLRRLGANVSTAAAPYRGEDSAQEEGVRLSCGVESAILVNVVQKTGGL
jgi:hypothetical protein